MNKVILKAFAKAWLKLCLDVIRHPLVLRTDAGHGVTVEFFHVHNNWKFFIRGAV
jgi:hypothetical protein